MPSGDRVLAEQLRRLVSATPVEDEGTVRASFLVPQESAGETAGA